jgi:hypothetical protein
LYSIEIDVLEIIFQMYYVAVLEGIHGTHTVIHVPLVGIEVAVLIQVGVDVDRFKNILKIYHSTGKGIII